MQPLGPASTSEAGSCWFAWLLGEITAGLLAGARWLWCEAVLWVTDDDDFDARLAAMRSRVRPGSFDPSWPGRLNGAALDAEPDTIVPGSQASLRIAPYMARQVTS